MDLRLPWGGRPLHVNEEQKERAYKCQLEDGAILGDKEALTSFFNWITDILHSSSALIFVQNPAQQPHADSDEDYWYH